MTSPQPRTSVLGFSGSKARVPVSVPKLNFYAFTLLFSSLVANKKHMHVPKPRLKEEGLQCQCPSDSSSKNEPDMKEYGEIRVHYASSSFSNQY